MRRSAAVLVALALVLVWSLAPEGRHPGVSFVLDLGSVRLVLKA